LVETAFELQFRRLFRDRFKFIRFLACGQKSNYSKPRKYLKLFNIPHFLRFTFIIQIGKKKILENCQLEIESHLPGVNF